MTKGILISVLLFSLLTVSCGETPNVTTGSKETAKASYKYSKPVQNIINSLKSMGNNVVDEKSVKLFYFSVPAQVISISGDKIFIMEYKDKATADDQAGKVYADGKSIGDRELIDWVSDPHFYKKDTIIIEYIGKEPKIIQSLEAVMGPQFAGYKPNP